MYIIPFTISLNKRNIMYYVNDIDDFILKYLLLKKTLDKIFVKEDM